MLADQPPQPIDDSTAEAATGRAITGEALAPRRRPRSDGSDALPRSGTRRRPARTAMRRDAAQSRRAHAARVPEPPSARRGADPGAGAGAAPARARPAGQLAGLLRARPAQPRRLRSAGKVRL